jgi:predicted house-cleaning noncanonical NTP pyrophosphatase (MazG superfamily)
MKTKNTYLLRCLARSNMEQSLAAKGCSITTSMVSGDEFCTLLKEKFIEEVNEFVAATDHQEIIAELADVQEVLLAIYQAYRIDPKTVQLYQEQKRIERGSFNGLVIETISCEAGSKAEQHLIERGRKKIC